MYAFPGTHQSKSVRWHRRYSSRSRWPSCWAGPHSSWCGEALTRWPCCVASPRRPRHCGTNPWSRRHDRRGLAPGPTGWVSQVRATS